MAPGEVDALDPVWLRRIILLEARAKPRLRNVAGLWRKPVVGARGATPRPGSMTEYIRTRGLLPEAEIDAIIALAPEDLLRFQDLAAEASVRPQMSAWVALFDRAAAMGLDGEGVLPLYPEQRGLEATPQV
jgi:hypothetical protein